MVPSSTTSLLTAFKIKTLQTSVFALTFDFLPNKLAGKNAPNIYKKNNNYNKTIIIKH